MSVPLWLVLMDHSLTKVSTKHSCLCKGGKKLKTLQIMVSSSFMHISKNLVFALGKVETSEIPNKQKACHFPKAGHSRFTKETKHLS